MDLMLPDQVIGNVNCRRPELNDRQDIGFQGIADHQEFRGRNFQMIQNPAVSVGILLAHDFNVGKILRQTGFPEFPSMLGFVKLLLQLFPVFLIFEAQFSLPM